MPTVKPIDKSKPSNHRCINCASWDRCTPIASNNGDDLRLCPERGKPVAYWNRCRHFQWNPNKTYKEET